jgi:hypothetical protein
MVVHSNDTGDDGIARALNSLRTLRNLSGRLGADEFYLAVRDHDRLVLLRRRTRSIDDPDMFKDKNWCIHAYEIRDATRPQSLRNSGRTNEQWRK